MKITMAGLVSLMGATMLALPAQACEKPAHAKSAPLAAVPSQIVVANSSHAAAAAAAEAEAEAEAEASSDGQAGVEKPAAGDAVATDVGTSQKRSGSSDTSDASDAKGEGFRGKSPCEMLESSMELFKTLQCEGQTDPDCVSLSESIDKLKGECNATK